MSESYWGFVNDERKPGHSGRRKLLITASLLLGVVVVAVSIYAVRGAQKMQQIMQLQQQAADQFGALNREFAPASPGSGTAPGRWAAVTGVRGSIEERLGPDGRDVFARLQKADGSGDLVALTGLLPKLNGLMDRLLPATTEAMRSHAMSPSEYQSMLASAVAVSIHNQTQAGARYSRLIRDFVSKSGNNVPQGELTPGEVIAMMGLQQEAGATVPEAVLTTLNASDDAMLALDLLAVSTRGMDIEAIQRKNKKKPALVN